MINIPLAAIPSQSLSVRLNSQQYDLRIHYCGNGVTVIDITINNEPLLTGARLVSNYPIIVSEYMENGNFILQTMNDEYPDYNFFGVTQYLVYASQTEIEAINGNTIQ
jgi:hypothetical protein